MGCYFCLVSTLLGQGQVLVSSGSTWRYFKGLSEPDGGNSAWRNLNYNDGNWLIGPTPFRYGDGNGGTVLSDMRNTYSTLFLRKEFQVQDPETVGRTDLAIDYDDGFIIWINDRQVLSVNAPGNPNHDAFAGSNHESGTPELFTLGDPDEIFLEGANVIAVQVFNVNLTSSDLMFNVQMSYEERDSVAPEIERVDPPPGSVIDSLDQIAIRFSELVQGVDTSSLLFNGNAASNISGSGDEYVFHFQLSEEGMAEVTIDPNHTITDFAVPPNRLDLNNPNTSWRYDIVDDLPPEVLGVHPLPGTEVSSLEFIDILFSESIDGLDAGDLLYNGESALSVSGAGAGPYRIELPEIQPGPVELRWIENHGIVDLSDSPNALNAETITYQLLENPQESSVYINEILTSNQTGLVDEEGIAQDWIEIFNDGTEPVSLDGWSISDDSRHPGKWVFPPVNVPGKGFLIVFASGKNSAIESIEGTILHTNFKLNANGEFLGLYDGAAPRTLVHSIGESYPEQRNDVSYGFKSDGDWTYFRTPSPGSLNSNFGLVGITPEPVFSTERGVFDHGFDLTLSCEDASAEIRYTVNGSEPTEQNGLLYTGPIDISRTSFIRAVAFSESRLPSKTITHSYLLNLPQTLQSLPVLSLVTDNQNLFGQTGIMETNPRNTIYRGRAWERPVSAEWMEMDGGGFQIDCGLRVQGGNYVRDRYNPRGSLPFSKYSFRLYFRGDYGPGKLEYPVVKGSTIQSYDKLVLRAGMNDHSNPFIVDEWVRRLSFDTGHIASRGSFVNLFINGQYKGYYNPTERIDQDFLQSWHGGDEAWDIIAQFGEIREGNANQWNRLRTQIQRSNLANRHEYEAIGKNLDLVNYVDYLLVNIYAGTGDWPHNNWRAARESSANGIFRFYVWDAEWAFGNAGRTVTVNTLTGELTRDADISNFFQSLKKSSEFRLLFADRVQKHMYNGGALTDEHVLKVYNELKSDMASVLPNIRALDRLWVGSRRRIILQHMQAEGLLSLVQAPEFSPHGGQIKSQDPVVLQAPQGEIFYTLDGSDPRLAWTGEISPTAVKVDSGQNLFLNRSGIAKARVRFNGQWSALTEAGFDLDPPVTPIVISEIMYHPAGGEWFEFIEVINRSGLEMDVSGHEFEGLDYRFPPGSIIAPGQAIVLASDRAPHLFEQRYPGLNVYGYYSGSLSNSGERINLLDLKNNTLLSLEYSDTQGWPKEADGDGYSLVLIDLDGPYSDPSNWHLSSSTGGDPGQHMENQRRLDVALNEIMALSESPLILERPTDWVEIRNNTSQTVALDGWGLTDDPADPYQFTFPPGSLIEPNAYLVLVSEEDGTGRYNSLGFGLNRKRESLWLTDAEGMTRDILTYGLQLPDSSLSRIDGKWILAEPTPGADNQMALPHETSTLRLNEWAIHKDNEASDWIELINVSSDSVAGLEGLIFKTQTGHFQYPYASYLEPGAHIRLWLSNNAGPDHLELSGGESFGFIELKDPDGGVLDRVNPVPLESGESQGRYPDGSLQIQFFETSASPGAANFVVDYNGPRLNEVLARGDGESGWVELFYSGDTPFDLSGMAIQVNDTAEDPWTFPDGLSMSPESYLVLLCNESIPGSVILNSEPLNTGRLISEKMGSVRLFDRSGQLVDRVEFGPQIEGMSIGIKSGSWLLLSDPTPGELNAQTSAFGDIRSLRVNEWMADPVDGEDWFELFNMASDPVWLSGLHLTDSPAIWDRDRHIIPALSFIAPGGWVEFTADGSPANGRDHVGFQLNAGGEMILIYVGGGQLIDKVQFSAQQMGQSMGRLPDGSDAIEVLNYATPGYSNTLQIQDSDGDDLPDAWEIEFDLDPNNSLDAKLDPDGDGADNLSEFVAGSDPRDASSVLIILVERSAEGNLVFRFNAIRGRHYVLESRTTPEHSETWEPVRTWNNLQLDTLIEYDESDLNSLQRYYRLRVVAE